MSEEIHPETPIGQDKSGFKFPTAYTVLFILLVLVVIATWFIPAGQYDKSEDGEPIPGSYHSAPQNPQRIIADGLLAPVNGMYGLQAEDGAVSIYNFGSLYGAIDVALFVLIIGGFLGMTMATGSIDAGIGKITIALAGREKWTIVILMMVFALGGVLFINLIHLLYLPLGFLIPSSSGLATVSMPIMAPLADTAGADRSLVVTAYQSAGGLLNLVNPTFAVVMGGLALGRVRY
ncbi:MAG TPA: hypothetical protein EYP41_19060, partial [Anaerolineae bacterium]|nr:hypothetical protein [Anaerolineae bacterium]